MTPTSTSSATPLVDAELLYNILMGAIEPELCTDMLPVLDELYLHETSEERTTRMERYADAVERFKNRAAEFSRDFGGAIRTMGDAAMSIAKEDQQQQDNYHMQSTEESLKNS